MNWNEAEALIYERIVVGVNLNPELRYRDVVEGPYYSCNQFDYDGVDGYLVQVGAEDFIEIPFSMLETLFNAAKENGGIYKSSIFSEYYPDQHIYQGSHVQVVGKIFELAEVAIQNGNTFRIL
jgi:hypothetical protein